MLRYGFGIILGEDLMPYSLDLRLKALSSYSEGFKTQQEVSDDFQINLSTFKRWLKRHRDGDSLAPITDGKGRPRLLDDKSMSFIKAEVKKNTSITLAELSDKLYRARKVVAGNAVLCRALQELNLRHKKLTIHASEKQSDEVKKKHKNI
jgi:transposase